MLGYRVPAPDEAMLISGGKAGRDGAPFRVVTGHGAFVMPFFRQVRFPAEAERTKSLAEAAASHNRVALDRMLIDQLPQIVREAAGGLANANINVLNGADGLGQIAAGLVGQGLTIFDSIKQNLTDGDVEWPPDEPAATTTDGDARAVPENAA